MTDHPRDDQATQASTTFGDLHPSLIPLSSWFLSGPEMAPTRDDHGANLEVEWLERHGVHTVGDLLALSPEDPYAWQGFGATKAKRLSAFVERLDDSATELLGARLEMSETED